jgi:hypothetical protein
MTYLKVLMNECFYRVVVNWDDMSALLSDVQPIVISALSCRSSH